MITNVTIVIGKGTVKDSRVLRFGYYRIDDQRTTVFRRLGKMFEPAHRGYPAKLDSGNVPPFER